VFGVGLQREDSEGPNGKLIGKKKSLKLVCITWFIAGGRELKTGKGGGVEGIGSEFRAIKVIKKGKKGVGRKISQGKNWF